MSIYTKTMFIAAFYVTCMSNLFAQTKISKKDNFTQTIENLQAIRDKNERLKLQQAPSVDVLSQLHFYDLAKLDEYLTDKGWVFSGSNKTDSLTTEISYAFNSTVDNKAWYTVGYIESEKQGNLLVFFHSSDAIQRKANARLKELSFENFNTSVTEEGLSKFYKSKQKNSIIIALNTTNTKTGYGNLTNYRIIVFDYRYFKKPLEK